MAEKREKNPDDRMRVFVEILPQCSECPNLEQGCPGCECEEECPLDVFNARGIMN